MQLRELRDYVGRQGWQVFQEYVDDGISGAKVTRPALERLMSDACLRRFEAVMVWKIDRFGRSVTQLIQNAQLLAKPTASASSLSHQASTLISAILRGGFCFTFWQA